MHYRSHYYKPTRAFEQIGIRKASAFIDTVCRYGLDIGLQREDVVSPMTGAFKEVQMGLDCLKKNSMLVDYQIRIQPTEEIGSFTFSVLAMFADRPRPHECVKMEYYIWGKACGKSDV